MPISEHNSFRPVRTVLLGNTRGSHCFTRGSRYIFRSFLIYGTYRELNAARLAQKPWSEPVRCDGLLNLIVSDMLINFNNFVHSIDLFAITAGMSDILNIINKTLRTDFRNHSVCIGSMLFSYCCWG